MVTQIMLERIYFQNLPIKMINVPTRSLGVMTCLARARVGRARWNAQARKDEWFRSGHSRRSLNWRSPISSMRKRRSLELRRSRRMRVPGERMIRDRPGMLGDRVVYTPPQGAHRRISQQTQLKLLKAQKGNFKRVSSVRQLQHQLEHAWRSSKKGVIRDERYHRDDALCCIQYSPCRVVFHSALCARLLLELRTQLCGWLLHKNGVQVAPIQMTTRVGLDVTSYSNLDDDTCRVGSNGGMTLKLPQLRW